MQGTLDLFPVQSSEQNTRMQNSLLLSDFHARICQWLEKGQVSMVIGLCYSLKRLGLLKKSGSNVKFLSLKTSKDYYPITTEKPLQQYCEQLPTLGFMSANGNCLILPGYYPKIESEFTLSDILQEKVGSEYFLSEKQTSYIQGGAKSCEIASTLSANDFKSWVGNFICDSGKGRRFEERNILPPLRANTGVGHGNYVFYGKSQEKLPKVVVPVLTPDRHEKRQNGRRFKENGEPSFTLNTQDRHGVQIDNNIRRLTEIECERLQGFPSQKITICLDQIKSHVPNVEAQCHKLQKYVLNVEKTDLSPNVLFAEKNMYSSSVQINRHAQKNVHITFGEREVRIHKLGKLVFSAKNAESKRWFHQAVQIEDFALLLVRMNLIQEKGILIGGEALHLNEQNSTHQRNLKKLEKKYGKEIMLHAKGVEIDSIILRLLLKFTTSYHLNMKKEDVILRTLYSFVIHVIIGFIPKEIQNVSLSEISLSIEHGWTQYGNYDGIVKEISKTQRYKLMGNAVTVAIVKLIGRRLYE